MTQAKHNVSALPSLPRAESQAPIAVIGLGNTLMEDEGAGVHALEQLRECYRDEGRIEFYDGGTKGLSLLPYMESCSRLLLIDAVESDAPPGAVLEFSRRELLNGSIPAKLSVHDIALADLLTLLALRRGFLMEDLKLIGVVPASMELATELSPTVGAALRHVKQRAQHVLDHWLDELSSQPQEAGALEESALEESALEESECA
ncbi:MAG TPA: hydrogenase maturation protease [Acidobacteriota bacterium]|nr:hydrogenase maturation protease [Acidobacteriota bacterium]